MSYLLDGPGPFAPLPRQEEYLRMLVATQAANPPDRLLNGEIQRYRQYIESRKSGVPLPNAPPLDPEALFDEIRRAGAVDEEQARRR